MHVKLIKLKNNGITVQNEAKITYDEGFGG